MAYETQGEKSAGRTHLCEAQSGYGSPNTDLAAHSWDAMVLAESRSRQRLPVGSGGYSSLIVARGWLDAKQYVNAKQEYEAVAQKPFPNQTATTRVSASALLSFSRGNFRRSSAFYP